MNESTTADTLVAAARQVFAQQGFAGASVRTITSQAGANLGAVTYHFGSKDALYQAVLEQAVTPLRQRVAAAAQGAGAPLTRIERILRALFDHMAEYPHLPRLVLQELATGHGLPPVVRNAMQANIGAVVRLIEQGQSEGTIRAGDAHHMALSVGAQPMFLALVRDALAQAVSLNQDDPETRRDLVENAVRFVRRGLSADAEDTS